LALQSGEAKIVLDLAQVRRADAKLLFRQCPPHRGPGAARILSSSIVWTLLIITSDALRHLNCELDGHFSLVLAYRKWLLTKSESSMRWEILPGGRC
jgi:hypothetical protein